LSDDSFEKDFAFGSDKMYEDGEKTDQAGKCFLKV